MAMLILAMLLFVGGHFIISGTGLRRRLIDRLGEGGFAALFSVYALATLVWVCIAFANAPIQYLWDTGTAGRWLTLILSALGIVLVILGISQPNPSLGPDRSGAVPAADGRGVLTITRHPLMWGIGLWAIGHLIANGDEAAVIFFGGLAVLALFGPLSQERRKRRAQGAQWQAFESETSYLPFVAILKGQAPLRLGRHGLIRLGIALAVVLLVLHGHGLVLGVPAWPG